MAGPPPQCSAPAPSCACPERRGGVGRKDRAWRWPHRRPRRRWADAIAAPGRRDLVGWRARTRWLYCLFCACVLRGSGALRQKNSVSLHHSFIVILMYDVGLAPGALLSLNISNEMPSNGTVLMILSSGQWDLWRHYGLRSLDGKSYSNYLVSYWRRPLYEQLAVRHIIRAAEPDRYFVCILNKFGAPMSLQSDIDYVNPDGQHLPLQMVGLPEILKVFTAAFFVLMAVVAFIVTFVWVRRATLLHALVVVCLWLKSFELAMKLKYFALIARVGEAPEQLYQVWQLCAKFHGILEIMLLLLIALGWRILRSRLSESERRFTLIAIGSTSILAALQVCCNVTVAEPAVNLWFYLVRVICYIVIIFATNFNLQLIHAHLVESPVAPYVAVLYQKHQAYAQFRRLFLAVIFRPSVILWIQVSMFKQEMWWVVNALDEAYAWAIYMGIFIALRPGSSRRGMLPLIRCVLAKPAEGESNGDMGSGNASASHSASRSSSHGTIASSPGGAAGAALAGGATANASSSTEDPGISVPYVPLLGDDTRAEESRAAAPPPRERRHLSGASGPQSALHTIRL
mmetsp:Transcript_52244/g.145783  ORF Transcript_52244/g.145783 Transcript_52244/m.145783 type:complete len:571 (-) Transcript_52244:75-1787(-)